MMLSREARSAFFTRTAEVISARMDRDRKSSTHLPTQYPTKMAPLEMAFFVEPATLAVDKAKRRT